MSAPIDVPPGLVAVCTPDGNFTPYCSASSPCPLGQSCVGGVGTPCPHGTYSLGSASFCSSCTAGRYNPEANLGYACSPCPPGQVSSTTGAVECDQICSAGRYASGGQSVCFDCEPGYAANDTAQSFCTVCSAGRYASNYGQSSCEQCEAGFVSVPASTLCSPCGPGTFSNFSGSSVCSSCTAGSFASNESSTECLPCPVGLISYSGAASCSPCPPSTYNLVTGSTSCASCTGSDKVGLVCVAGAVQVLAGYYAFVEVGETSSMGLKTVPCPLNYCPGSGSESILQLVSTEDISSLTTSTQLPQCTYPRSNSVLCSECVSGYADIGGECEWCPGVKWSSLLVVFLLSFILVIFLLVGAQSSSGAMESFLYFAQTAVLLIGASEMQQTQSKLLHFLNLAPFAAATTCVAPLSPQQQLLLTLFQPLYLIGCLIVVGAVHAALWHCMSRSESHFIRLLRVTVRAWSPVRYWRGALAVLSFSYNSVSIAALNFLSCIDIPGFGRRVFSTPSISCDSGSYRVYLSFVILTLIFFVAGLPLGVALMLQRIGLAKQQAHSRKRLESTSNSESVTKLPKIESNMSPVASSPEDILPSKYVTSDVDVEDISTASNPAEKDVLSLSDAMIELWASIYRPATLSLAAERRWWGYFFESYHLEAQPYARPLYLLRRSSFLCITTFIITSPVSKYVLFALFTCVFLLLHLWLQPLESKHLNRLESVAQVPLLLLCILFLGWIPGQDDTPIVVQLTEVALLIVTGLILLLAVLQNVLRSMKERKAAATTPTEHTHATSSSISSSSLQSQKDEKRSVEQLEVAPHVQSDNARSDSIPQISVAEEYEMTSIVSATSSEAHVVATERET